MTDFKNKVIVVSGGTSGIGLVTAQHLESLGARVIVFGSNEDKINNIQETTNLKCYQVDIQNHQEIKSFFVKIHDQYKTIDVLINCAGIGVFGEVSKIDDNDIEKCISINLTGNIIVTKYAIKIMKSQKCGHIICLESIASKKGFKYGGIYTATKAGLASFNEVLWNEVKGDNIQMTCIRPGFVNTGFLKGGNDYNMEALLTPHDIANAIIFSLSQSRNSTISEIVIRPLQKEGQDLFVNIINDRYNY